MKAHVEIRPKEYKWMEMGEPECGEDFCDRCGDCLECFWGDQCPELPEHSWVIYHEKYLEKIKEVAAEKCFENEKEK